MVSNPGVNRGRALEKGGEQPCSEASLRILWVFTTHRLFFRPAGRKNDRMKEKSTVLPQARTGFCTGSGKRIPTRTN